MISKQQETARSNTSQGPRAGGSPCELPLSRLVFSSPLTWPGLDAPAILPTFPRASPSAPVATVGGLPAPTPRSALLARPSSTPRWIRAAAAVGCGATSSTASIVAPSSRFRWEPPSPAGPRTWDPGGGPDSTSPSAQSISAPSIAPTIGTGVSPGRPSPAERKTLRKVALQVRRRRRRLSLLAVLPSLLTVTFRNLPLYR